MKPLRLLHNAKSNKTPRVSRLYLKLRSKFTVSFFLLVMLPFLAFTACAYFYSRAALERNTYEMTLINLSQEKNSISGYLTSLESSVSSLSGYTPLAELLRNGAPSTIADTGAGIFKRSAGVCLTDSQLGDLLSAYIIRDNEIILAYSKNNKYAVMSNPSSQPWYSGALDEPSAVYVLGAAQRFYDAGVSTAVFSLAKAMEGAESGSKPAVLLLDFDYGILSNVMEPGNAPETGEERLITDSRGSVVYSKDPGILTISPADDLLLEADKERGFERTVYKGENVYMTYVRFPELPWTFISLLPVRSVTEGLLPSSGFAIPACIIAAVIILLIYLFVSLKLLDPINELTAVISDYEKGNFSEIPGPMALAAGQAAPGGMGGASEIDYLINKVNNIKLKQKEAELNSLQNQINPHFLYNTLESIRGAALYHGIHEIAAMSKALSLLFRYSISDRVLVSIKEEIQHLDNYMSIQNFRYENKFDLVYSIPPELYSYKILKLVLQPLIENSIKHGLEMKLGKGLIKLEILSLDSTIKIQISDDGLGILPKKVEELNRALSRNEYLAGHEGDRTGTGIGVRNVNSRIKLYFGEQYGLKFRDAMIGTTVEITLPAVKDD